METVLITGPTSGIGLELAICFAKNGNELILVGRGAQRLRALANQFEKEYGVPVETIVSDLSKPSAVTHIEKTIRTRKKKVDILVNNAGFATYGKFDQIEWNVQAEMMHVNMDALTQLTRAFLPEMIKRKHGRILNVASTAAFQPGPLMATYYASKAFVLYFSEALAEELEGSGVSVTTLCPGPTRTGFQERARMEDAKVIREGRLQSPVDVARAGFEGVMSGKRIVIPGLQNQLGALAARLVPLSFSARIVKGIQEKVSHEK
ncbi:MAG: SDR family oxidoreductase [archaeon]